MANPYSGAVVRKLAYTKALLRLESASSDNPVARMALSEGALLHLYGAWLSFVREIAANYRVVDTATLSSAAALTDALLAVGKIPSEATELLDLENEPASWLSELLVLRAQLDELPSLATPAPVAEGRVQVTNVNTTVHRPDGATVQRLLDAFTDLVERQRETMIEC